MIAKARFWFDRGTVEVFDKYGRHLPEYEGRYNRVAGAILRDARPDCVFERACDWRRMNRLARIGEKVHGVEPSKPRPDETRISVVPRRFW